MVSPWLPVSPTFCLSIRLSVEKWFPHDNSISFWHTMMILYKCIAHDRKKTPYWCLGQGQICTFKFASFPHGRTVTFWHKVMILNTRWPWPKGDLYYFWGQKVKGRGQTRTLSFDHFPHDNSISFWHTIIILDTWVDYDPRRTSIDFGVKRSKVKVIFELWTVSA